LLILPRLGRERPGRSRRGEQTGVPGPQRQAQAPTEDVLQGRGALVARRVDDLGEQMRCCGGQHLPEGRVVGHQREHVLGLRASLPDQAGRDLGGQAERGRSLPGLLEQLGQRPAAGQADLVGAASGPAAVPLDHAVHHVLGHPAVGRELPTGDREQATRALDEGVPPAEVAHRARARGADQRPHPGPGAQHVVGTEACPEDRVAGSKDVLEVGGGQREPVERPGVRRVGGAQDALASPRDGEHRAAVALLAGQQDARLQQGEALARHHHVNSLTGLHDGRAPRLLQALQPVDPHARGVDDMPGLHCDVGTRELVVHQRTAHPAGGVLVQARDFRVGDRLGPEAASGLHDRQYQPRVIGGAVAVEVGVGELAVDQGRGERDRLVGRDPLVPAQPGLPDGQSEHVVGRQAQPEQAALGGVRPHGVEEIHRAHEVRREAHEQLALHHTLPDQAELVVLQVAQTSVHELAALAAGTAGEVALVDDRDAKAPAGRVQGDARTGRPHAHDQDVQLLLGCVRELGRAGADREGRTTHG